MAPAKIKLSGKTAAWLVSAIVLLGAAVLYLAFTRVPDPGFEGRRVSAWFDDLCSGVFGGTPRAAKFNEAYHAFARMGSEAVPYLASQLRYGRSGQLERALLRLRNFSLTAPLVKFAILPSSRRQYAATALRQIGPLAEAAVPALMESWKRDSSAMRVESVAALAAIMNMRIPEGAPPVEWQAFEAKVIAEAATKNPAAASALGIVLAPAPTTITPAAATR